MSNFVSALTYARSVETWGDRLRAGNSLISIPLARVASKVVSTETHVVQKFTLLEERIRKTYERVTLLSNLKQWGVQTIIDGSPELIPAIEKAAPGLLEAEDQKGLLETAYATQSQRLETLQRELIQWTFLQPKWQYLPEDQIFNMITQVKATLTSKIKFIQDPSIPFLKLAIEERVKWHIERLPDDDFHNRLFESLHREVGQIFQQIPDMYYNTFLGADHPKVQENLLNQNDLVTITPEDVKDHIVELQLKAAAAATDK